MTVLSGVKEYVHLAGTDELDEFQRSVYDVLLDVAKSVAHASGVDLVLNESAKLQIYHYFGKDEDGYEDEDEGEGEGEGEAPQLVDTGMDETTAGTPAAWGCPEHIDSGVITVILSDAPGLEVFDQLVGSWVDVGDAAPDWNDVATNGLTATVLVGHTLELASNGAYKAALHRVRQTERKSVVLKLHAHGAAWIPAAGCTVRDVIQAFERAHPSVNPQPDSSRPSAVAGSLVTVDKRSIVSHVCPEIVGLFQEDLVGSRSSLPLLIRGPLLHSAAHPVLLNAYFYVWVLQSWAASMHLVLPNDPCERILGMIPMNWRATTVAEAATRISELCREANPGRIKLVFAGRLFGQAHGARPLTELAPGIFDTTIAQDLKFVRFDDQPPGPLGNHINVKVVSQDGSEIFFKVQMHKPLVHLMYAWCHRRGIAVAAVRFIFGGTRFNAIQTPADLQMQDGDVIDVMINQCGD